MSTNPNDPNQFNPQGNPQGAPHDEWFVEFQHPQADQGVPNYQPGQFVQNYQQPQYPQGYPQYQQGYPQPQYPQDFQQMQYPQDYQPGMYADPQQFASAPVDPQFVNNPGYPQYPASPDYVQPQGIPQYPMEPEFIQPQGIPPYGQDYQQPYPYSQEYAQPVQPVQPEFQGSPFVQEAPVQAAPVYPQDPADLAPTIIKPDRVSKQPDTIIEAKPEPKPVEPAPQIQQSQAPQVEPAPQIQQAQAPVYTQPEPQIVQPVPEYQQPPVESFFEEFPQPAQPVRQAPMPQPVKPAAPQAPVAPPYQPSAEVDPLEQYRQYDSDSYEEDEDEDEPEKKRGKNTFVIVIASIMAFLAAAAAVFFIFIMPKLKDDNGTSKTRKPRTSDTDIEDTTDDTEDTDDTDEPDDTTVPDDTDPSDTSDTVAPTSMNVRQNVTSASQITSSQMDEMKDITSQDFTETIALNSKIGFKEFTYLGTIVMGSNDPSDTSIPGSIVYLVYQVQYTEKNEANKPVKEYYWYEGFGGVYADGTFDKGARYQMSTQYNGAGWASAGTTDISSARNEIKSSSKYTVLEDNIDTSLIVPLPTTDAQGFVFPNSDTQRIDDAEIPKLSDEDLRKAINEIWARHGYIFRKKEILDYYRQYEWYKETVPADEWDKNGQNHYLNDVEKDNINRLVKEREKRGGNGA
jgi:hypothetical protein